MDYPEEVIDLAIRLFFEKHKELKKLFRCWYGNVKQFWVHEFILRE